MDELMRRSGVHPPVPLSGFLQYPASHMGSLTVAIGVNKRKARIAMKVLIQIEQEAIKSQPLMLLYAKKI
jgi:hypothetical protein